jgi:hypothetical protein
MRFDNGRPAAVFLVTVALLGGCRPKAPGSAATDSAITSARPDTASSTAAPASSSQSDSIVLRTDKTQYRAGEKITLTFENKSARSYTFNPCMRTLERDEKGPWTPIAEPGRICTMEAWLLDPHGTRTGPTELPTPLSAGRYRIVVRMTVDASGGAPSSAVNAVSDPITVS